VLEFVTKRYGVRIDSATEGVSDANYSPHTDRLAFADGLNGVDFTEDLNPEQGAGGVTGIDHGLLTRAPGETGRKSNIYSNGDGTTYWVDSTAPSPTSFNRGATAASSVLVMDYYFRKDDPAATLSAVITNVILEGLSYVDPLSLGVGYCPTEVPDCTAKGDKIFARMEIYVLDDAGNLLRGYYTESSLNQGMQSWTAGTTNLAGPVDIWTSADMEFNPDAQDPAGSSPGTHATYKLKAPVVHDISLAGVPDRFWVSVQATTYAANATHVEEPYRAAYFRDPLRSGSPDAAVKLQPAGLTALTPPGPKPAILPAAACAGPPDPLAGTLQLELTELHTTELGVGRLQVQVTRSGGTRGEVSVDLTSSDGSAIGGVDYENVSQTLRFADGSEGTRAADVLVLEDGVVEQNETFTLALGNVRGCATLGTASNALVTIHDLDKATYTLGGTVQGLQGSGLVLRSNGFDVVVNASGNFTLPSTYLSGTVYDLQITAQPNNPLQVCRVTQGQGTIGSANVTDMMVVCDPPAPPPAGGGLDPSFSGGKVASSSYGGIISMALQPDGKIVALTDFNRLLRFQADGVLDASFGTGGAVTATLGGNSLDVLHAVALQADGGILVAGLARGGSADDMGVRRYLPDGTVDASFGSAGFVRVDIAGYADDATALVVQPDGKIVLGGLAVVTLVGASDLAVARLDSTGALDTSFGTGGKVTANIGGNFDTAAAMALQVDGAIVLAGRAASSGGATPDTSVLRLSSVGTVDLALKLPLTSDWDEATGVAVRPDGKIVLSLEARAAGGLYQHALAQLKPDGALDETFGTLGVALSSFSVGGDHARTLLLLPDGRIVTAGHVRNQVLQLTDKDDFLVTRHLTDGSLDSSFGTGGSIIVDFFGAADSARALRLQPDGRVVVGGSARNGNNSGLGLLRLVP
jgi:uncharacterized delta-60 repeat protein